MNDAQIFRLAKPKKKGVLPLIFSRFLIIVLLIILQVLLIVGFYGWLGEYIPYFSAILRLFTLAMILYLFNSTMDSTAKLTWMFIIAILPLPGAAFLFFTQTNAGHRKIKRRVEKLIDDTKNSIKQSENVSAELKRDGSGTDDLCTYLNRSGCFPVYDSTEVSYFPLGQDKFAAMLTELKKAEKYIFMEYFIIEEGYMWGEILKILVEKAKAVVDTINLDYRSLYHHFECAAYLYKTDCIPEIEQDFQDTLAKCRKVTPETIKNERISYKLMGSLMKFVAPLM